MLETDMPSKELSRVGYRVCIITGGSSEGVTLRLKGLGIKDIYTGISNKLDTFEEYVYAYEIDTAGVLYLGDDILIMNQCDLLVCHAALKMPLMKLLK